MDNAFPFEISFQINVFDQIDCEFDQQQIVNGVDFQKGQNRVLRSLFKKLTLRFVEDFENLGYEVVDFRLDDSFVDDVIQVHQRRFDFIGNVKILFENVKHNLKIQKRVFANAFELIRVENAEDDLDQVGVKSGRFGKQIYDVFEESLIDSAQNETQIVHKLCEFESHKNKLILFASDEDGQHFGELINFSLVYLLPERLDQNLVRKKLVFNKGREHFNRSLQHQLCAAVVFVFSFFAGDFD
jgi:hypothetical protein